VNHLRPRILECRAAAGRQILDITVAVNGETFAACFDAADTFSVMQWTGSLEVCRITAPSTVEAVTFSPDGRQIAAACADGRVYVFAVPDGHQVTNMQGGQEGYYEIAWSPDGNLIAAGHYDPLVSLFDMRGNAGPVILDSGVFCDEGRTAVAFSPDGALLATSAGSNIVRRSVPRMKSRKLSLRNQGFIIDLGFSNHGNHIAGLAEREGKCSLHLWGGDTDRALGHILLPAFSQRMAWSFDDSFVAVIESDRPGVSLWDPATFARSLQSLEEVAMSMSAIAANPQRLALIAGSDAGDIVIWEA